MMKNNSEIEYFSLFGRLGQFWSVWIYFRHEAVSFYFCNFEKVSKIGDSGKALDLEIKFFNVLLGTLAPLLDIFEPRLFKTYHAPVDFIFIFLSYG